MLDKFKKLIGASPEAETSEAGQELSAMKEQYDAALSEATEVIEAANAKVAELSAELETVKTALAKVEADKVAAVASAAAAKLTARKEKVGAAIGTEKAEGLMLATEALDDAAFEAVVSALAGSVAVEASTSLFKEVGVSADVDAAKVDEESEEMKLLKQKYHSTV